MAGAAREVGGHRSGDVAVLQRQGIGRCVGMVGSLGPAAAPSSRSAKAPGSGGVLVIGAGPMAGGWVEWCVGVWHGSARCYGNGVLVQGGVGLPGAINGGLGGWLWEFGRFPTRGAPLPFWRGLQATKGLRPSRLRDA